MASVAAVFSDMLHARRGFALEGPDQRLCVEPCALPGSSLTSASLSAAVEAEPGGPSAVEGTVFGIRCF